MNRNVVIAFTDKEANYIAACLRESILRMESDPWLHQGNKPHLLWFTQRLAGRFRRLHQAAIRKSIGEKRWKEIHRIVAASSRRVKQEAVNDTTIDD